MKATEKSPTLNDSKEYREALAKLGELQNARAAKSSKRQEIIGARNSEFTKLKDSDVMRKAEALAQGGSINDPELRRFDKDLETLSEEISILDHGIRLQERAVDDIAAQVSVHALARVQPQHVQIVREMASAMGCLAFLNAAEQDFRSDLESAGFVNVNGYLRPMFNHAGRINDENSRANAFLNECVEFGFITQKEADMLRNGGRL